MLTNDQLHALGIVEGRKAKIEFVSGVDVSGRVENILRRDGKLLLITFSNCTAKYGDRVLFNPDWGMYDMAVGERISSVFNGAADKDAYNQVALVPKERTIKVPSDAKRKRLENLYAQVRKIRESKAGYERLGEIWETQQAEHPEDWLLSMEIFEILDATDQQRELKTQDRKVPEREESEDERSLDADQLGIPVGRVPQETGIPGRVTSLAQVGSRFAVRSAEDWSFRRAAHSGGQLRAKSRNSEIPQVRSRFSTHLLGMTAKSLRL